MAEIILETKLVGDIEGKFFIPSYQRGYRWGKKEVELMLNDIISNKDNPYSLQPIVVRKLADQFELVDGQQRLTTIFLIYKFMHIKSNGFLSDAKFSLEYETRDKSQEYLQNIDLTLREDNIDFWHIANAYETIQNFFQDKKQSIITDLNRYFDNNVRVIWYEIPEAESAVDLFTRLNIGKIPLTSSELVKALFLRTEAEDLRSQQEEIALQWDNIERDLHDDSLWSFLTNEEKSKYATRIDLLLDLIAEKKTDEREEYFTFFYFDDLVKNGKSLKEVWKQIHLTFLILKEWRYNHELYHKIGYLIAAEWLSLSDIFHQTKTMRKSEIKNFLDDEIKKSIDFDNTSYDDLSYDNEKHKTYIERLLLLFNVESMRTLDDGKQWFPFDKHKDAMWSLEHIHAQHSQGLETNEKIKQWLNAHIESLKSLEDTKELVDQLEDLLVAIETNPKTTRVKSDFSPLQEKVVQKLSQGGADYLHKLSNMALLDSADNAALSNYVFDAKRNIVIEWDKNGKYIPFCTKMVFFKYYTPSVDNQLHFWGVKDREAYVAAINKKLAKYLKAPINNSNE